jgi:hypothetical protein
MPQFYYLLIDDYIYIFVMYFITTITCFTFIDARVSSTAFTGKAMTNVKVSFDAIGNLE